MRIAICSSNRLGDGLLMMIVAYNYVKAGHEVVFYHDYLGEMKQWFDFPIEFKKYPLLCNLVEELKPYEKIIAEYHFADSVRVLESYRMDESSFPLTFLYFSTHKKKMRQILDTDYLISRQESIVTGLVKACQTFLPEIESTKSNGIKAPEGLVFGKYPTRVAVHPTSSQAIKNWGSTQFYQLAMLLKKKGYDCVFCLGKNETEKWGVPGHCIEKESFNNLHELASFIYESKYFIGNDSGLGHLASNLLVPTVSIFSRRKSSIFWRPNWGNGKIVVPTIGIPNIKFLRLRDKVWKYFVTVQNVYKTFEELVKC